MTELSLPQEHKVRKKEACPVQTELELPCRTRFGLTSPPLLLQQF